MLGAALAGATLDPERLLWVPGRKAIFLPTPKALYRIGDTVHVRIPQRFVIRAGEAFIPHRLDAQYANITITNAVMANYDWSAHA